MNGFCDYKGCEAPSDVRPILLLFAPWPSDCPARGVLMYEFCAAHGSAMTVDYFVTDEGWDQICRVFDHMGRVRPDRSRVRLEMEPLLHVERN